MLKKILLLFLSIFLAYQSYELVGIIFRIEAASWPLVLFIAWIFNMIVTGIFALSGFAFPTQKILPEAYYKIYQPERLKRIHKALRVELFRKFLLMTVWRKAADRKRYFDGKKTGIENLITQSKKSEFGHLIPFLIIGILGIYWLAIGYIKLGVFTLLFNFSGNFYPIILQRHHRMRIQRIRGRKAASGMN